MGCNGYGTVAQSPYANHTPPPPLKGGREGDEYLTVGEVANLVRVHKNTVYRWIDDRDLTAHRFGRTVRIRRGDLANFIDASRHAGNGNR